MLANSLVELFKHGGYIMWPILVVAIVSIAIVGERCIWWIRESSRRQPDRLEKVLAALENGDFPEAARQSNESQDPVVRMIWHGLNHVNASLQGALQVAAGAEIKRAGRFLMVMDTCITVAPLLGLLGTVLGFINTFMVLQAEALYANSSKMSEGAGPAVICCAAGLAVAIPVPAGYNYLVSRVNYIVNDMERAANEIVNIVSDNGRSKSA